MKAFVLRNTCLIFCYLIVTYVASAQEFIFDRFTVNNGLPLNVTKCIIQDRYGFIWIANLSSLTRYDGIHFKVYDHSNDVNSLIAGNVKALAEDNQGRIWIGTTAGICYFDYETNQFYSLHEGQIQGVKKFVINGNRLWIGAAANGIYSLDLETLKLIEIEPHLNEQLKKSNVHNISVIENSVYIPTSNGLYKYDPTDKTYSNYLIDGHEDNQHVLDAIRYKTDEILAATFFGLKILKGHKLVQFRNANGDRILENLELLRLFSDSKNIIWIGSKWEGLYRLDPESFELQQFKNDVNDQLSLVDNAVVNFFEDRSGNLWIGTENGISKFSRLKYNFNLYQHERFNENSLAENAVYAMLEDDGNIWVAYLRKGVDVFNPQMRLIKRYESSEKLPIRWIIEMLKDVNGNIWLASKNDGLFYYDKRRQKFHNYTFQSTNGELGSNLINSIQTSSDGSIWLGTADGLFLIDSLAIRSGEHRFKEVNDLKNTVINRLYIDHDDQLWIGSSDAVIHYNFRSNQLKNYLFSISDITAIYEDSFHQLWIGSAKDGIVKYNHQNNSSTYISKKDGLSSNRISSIFEDQYERIWICSKDNITNYNRQTNNYTILSETDGLQGAYFHENSFLLHSSGRVILGGANGINIVYPKSRQNDIKPNFELVDFKIFNQSKEFNESINLVSKIDLNYKENTFTIAYASLDFTNPNKNQYKYRMNGI
ncbi:MAG: hypothetical protein KDD94_07260, partial [Calditrichaeota bacterium]|nr:hypothetical protein [Calditrichota bacterium]